MTYTDKDLQYLKEYIEREVGFGSDPALLQLKAMISRLEAAEKVCEQFIDDNECNSFCGYHCRNVDAWRKAKGETV